MAILGINISGFHSSACLVSDKEIKAAITEERLSRIKKDKSFPKKAIKYCLETAKISQKDITDIFIGWNVKFYIEKSDNTLYDALQNRGKMSYLALNELSSISKEKVEEITEEIKTVNSNWKIHFINHHFAHLSSAFFTSGFTNSDFLVADGFGEHTTGFVGNIFYNSKNKKYEINAFNEFRTPHSLGSFYSAFTEFLGFTPNGDEWKVMALASLGNPDIYYEKVRQLIKVDGLNFELDLSYFEHYLFFTEHYYSPKFVKVFGAPAKDDKLLQRHYDLVASLQKVVEEVVIEILNKLQKKTKNKNITIAGGFFMNSVLNGKILEKTQYEKIAIGGSPDDSGISIGAALYGLNFIKKQKFNISLNHNYFGREYSTKEIIEELKKRKIDYSVLANPFSVAAEKIREKKIVAWFQGKSEFGQRALGNRSIIADPTYPDIKDLINKSIKYREAFRPFAPAVLKESQGKYFVIPKNQDSYFMEKVFMFKEEFWDKLPAVVHFDKSGRLQSVDQKINPKFHKLIKEFEKLSGYPIVLNTSFNLNGMPLVETPADAIDCFYKSGIDCLIMNNILVEKGEAN